MELKNTKFCKSFNARTLLVVLILLFATFFGGLGLQLTGLTNGSKNAAIETPEISTNLDDKVSASGVTINVYVATSSGFSNASGTACGTVKAYASYNNGGTLLSGTGTTSFDMEAGILGAATKLCGLVAEASSGYYYLGVISTNNSTRKRNYFKHTGSIAGQSFTNSSTYGEEGVKGAYVDKGTYSNFFVSFYFAPKNTVTFDKQSGSGGTSSATAIYDLAMPSITVPTRTGYKFGGYYTSTGGSGTQYYTADGASARNWDKIVSTTLYAQWTARESLVQFHPQGGSGGTSEIFATYNSAMPSITIPTRTGYKFGGYYTSTGGSGTQYYKADGTSARNWDGTAAIWLYAKWTALTNTVTFDKQGGSGGTNSVTTTYGSAMPSITIPTLTGNTFTGYYTSINGSGTQYYTSTGASARNWNQTENDTLYADWILNTYTVTLEQQGGTGGDTSFIATYSSNIGGVANVPTKQGYTFGGYYTGANGTGTMYLDESGNLDRHWDITSNTTLYAKWIAASVTFPEYDVWKDKVNTLTGIAYGDITKIQFLRSAPSGYTLKGSMYDTGALEVYQGSTKTEIAFVWSETIYASESCYYLFNDCEAVKTIIFTNFNTSNVTVMNNMFSSCSSLTSLDLTGFSTNNVTSMHSMFFGCTSLTYINLSSFNTSSVTDIGYMFRECESLNGTFGIGGTAINISKNFTTNNVTDISWLFYFCSKLTSIDLSNFNTASAINMCNMFYYCTNLTNLVLPNTFTTANVKGTGTYNGFNYMFHNCSQLTELDISMFTIKDSATVTTSSMFSGMSALKTFIAPNTLKQELTLPSSHFVKTSLSVGSRVLTKTATDTDDGKTFKYGYTLTANSNNGTFSRTTGWTLSDTTKGTKIVLFDETIDNFPTTTRTGYRLSGWKTGTSSGTEYTTSSSLTAATTVYANWVISSVTFPEYDVWKDKVNTLTGIAYGNITKIQFLTSAPSGYTLKGTLYDSGAIQVYQGSITTEIAFVWSETIYAPISSYSLFSSCKAVTTIVFTNFNTSNVESMESMFRWCEKLTSLNLNNFNTDNVTDMSYMFNYCYVLPNLDLSGFNTSNVTNMEWMFLDCETFTSLNLSNFNTNKVTDMNQMFYGCSGLTSYNISNFNTSNVTSISGMFYGCSSLTTINLSHFNTSKVTSMYRTFGECTALTNLNISSFDTSKVTDMSSMFNGCTNLPSIDVSNFNTSSVTEIYSMFSDCKKITTLNISNFTIGTSSTVTASNIFSGMSALKTLIAPNSLGQTLTLPSANFVDTTLAVANRALTNTVSATDDGKTFKYGYTLTANSNKGSFSATENWKLTNSTIATKIVLFDEAIVNFPAVTRAGYTLSGWKTSTNGGTQYITSSNLTANTTVYAQWTLVDYTITIDSNGGTGGAINNNKYTISTTSSQTRTLTHPTRTGYNFSGWSVGSGYTGTAPSVSGTTLTIPANTYGNFTLIAQWSINYTITYELNGGSVSGTNPTSFTYTSTLSEILISPTKSGYDFVGWTCSNNNVQITESDKDGYEILIVAGTVAENITLTANWISSSVIFPDDWRTTTRQLTGIEASSLTRLLFSTSAPSGYTLKGALYDTGVLQVYQGSVATEIAFVWPSTIYAPTNSTGLFSGCKNLMSIMFKNFNTSNVTTMERMFNECESLSGALDLSNFNTNNVTNMLEMFNGCKNLLDVNINNFNTVNVKNMRAMFAGCIELISLDLSSFNTSNVTDMSNMFNGCEELIGTFGVNGTAIKISNYFTTNKVTDMSGMFSLCFGLTSIDLSSFNTSNVTNMSNLFYICNDLTGTFGTNGTAIKISNNFTTNKVTNMSNMFYGCSGLTNINVSSFNTSIVTNMSYMFSGCSCLTSLIMSSSFTTANVKGTGTNNGFNYMFHNCSKLTELNISMFTITDSATVTTSNIFSGMIALKTLIAPNTLEQALTLPSANFVDTTLAVGSRVKTNTVTATDDGKTFKYAYTLTANSNNGTFSETTGWTLTDTTKATKIVLFDETINNFPTATCSGYTLTGWKTNTSSGTEYTTSSKLTSNTTVYAQWTEIEYTITIDSNGGTGGAINNNKYTINTSSGQARTLTNPTRNSYNFTGWSVGSGYTGTAPSVSGTTLTIPANTYGNFTLTAQWSVNTYTITYELNGGSVSGTNPTSFTYASTLSEILISPTKSGYNFAGWTCSNNNVQITESDKGDIEILIVAGTVAENITLTANWTAIIYTITYNLNGGTVASPGNPTGYSADAPTFSLINPTKTGYIFAGWTGTGLDSATITVTIPSGSTGNRSYTATWTLTNAYFHAGWQKQTQKLIANTEITSIEFTDEQPSTTNLKIADSVANPIAVGASSLTNNSSTYLDTVIAYVYIDGSIKIYSASEIYAPQNCNYLFSSSDFNNELTTLKTLNLSNFNTSGVTSMSNMFRGCESLVGTFGLNGTAIKITNKFTTDNVTNIRNLFSYCEGLTFIDLSTFNTSNVLNMHGLFDYCKKATGTFGLNGTAIKIGANFTTEKVTDIGAMFHGCHELTGIDFSGFNTEKVTNMSVMFRYCDKLTFIDISNFNTINVTNMNSMFSTNKGLVGTFGLNGTAIKIGVNFKTTNITDIGDLFSYSGGLTAIDISMFTINSTTNVLNMFAGVSTLKTIIAPNSLAQDLALPNSNFVDTTLAVGSRVKTNTVSATDDGKTFKYGYTLTAGGNYGTLSADNEGHWTIADDSLSATKIVLFDETINNFPTATRAGYTLSGWKVNVNTEYTTSSYLTANTTVYANWIGNITVVKINRNDVAWLNSGIKVALYNRTVKVYDYNDATIDKESVSWVGVAEGTYDIYATKISNSVETMVDTGVDIVVTTTGLATIDYYLINYYTTSATVSTIYSVLKNQTYGYENATRNNYTHVGWNTDSTATSASWNAGTQTSISTKDWYAVWSDKTGTHTTETVLTHTFYVSSDTSTFTRQTVVINHFANDTVIYNYNLSKSENLKDDTEANNYTYTDLEYQTATRDGYTHIGWNADNTETNATWTSDAITPTSAETWYAVWSDKTGIHTTETVLTHTFYVSNDTSIFTRQTVVTNHFANDIVRYNYNLSKSENLNDDTEANSYTYTDLEYQTATRDGYTFIGWTQSSTGVVATWTSGTRTPTSAEIWYAVWQRAVYVVGNDNGTMVNGATATLNCAYNGNITNIIANVPADITKNGYTFVGWSTDTNSTEVVSTVEIMCTGETTTSTVYAVWSNENGYYITTDTLTHTFYKTSDTDKTTVDTTITYSYSGDKVYYNYQLTKIRQENKGTLTNTSYSELEYQTATRDGYTHIGWNADNTETNATWTNGARTPTSAETWYAVWSYTAVASYDGNGNTGGSTNYTSGTAYSNYDLSQIENATIILADNGFVKVGYTFSKWAEGSVNGAQYEQGASVNIGTNTTYYAIWTENTDTAYTIKHYVMNTDGSYPNSATKTETLSGTTNELLTLANLKDSSLEIVDGISYVYGQVNGLTVTTTTILPDGTREINLYYARQMYTVTLTKGTGIASVSGDGTFYYEATVSVDAEVKNGYNWLEWTGTYVSTDKNYSFTITSEVSLTANATLNTYTVTYNATQNGGVFNSANQYTSTAVVGSGKAVDLSKINRYGVKSGWYFVGWNTDVNATKSLSSLTMDSADITLYAIYSKTLVGVFYYGLNKANYASESVTIYNTEESGIINSPSNKANITYNSLVFEVDGWRDDTVAGEKEYSSGQISISENKYFYQVYTRTLTVSYNANGGNSTPDNQITTQYYNTDGSVSAHTFNLAEEISRIGYRFNKWAKNSINGTQYDAGESVLLNTNVTFFAIWNLAEYTVTLDSQGGVNGTNSVIALFGDNMPSIDIPTRLNFVFDGYYTSSNGEGEQYYTQDGKSAKICDLDKDITLYANWIDEVLITTNATEKYENSGFYVYIYITNIERVDTVTFDAWSVINGQDDIVSAQGETGSWTVEGYDFNYRYLVLLTEHNNQIGSYNVKITVQGNNVNIVNTMENIYYDFEIIKPSETLNANIGTIILIAIVIVIVLIGVICVIIIINKKKRKKSKFILPIKK